MKCLPKSRSFNFYRGLALVAVALLLLGGCARLRHKPLVDAPPPVEIAAPAPPLANGAIFQPGFGTRPLFEDLRPRAPGDVLTVIFNEQVSASRNAQSNASRKSSTSFTPDVVPSGIRGLGELGLDVKGEQDFAGSGGAKANNTFTGTLTVTVVQVLNNGNLRVHGEKQIAINNGTEYIRFAGTVDPRTITASNSVQSTQVADSRIEYVGKGYVNDAQNMGWLQRVLLKVWPF